VQFVAIKGLDFPDAIGQLSDESVPLVAGKKILRPLKYKSSTIKDN
jgi:hypothetical protein